MAAIATGLGDVGSGGIPSGSGGGDITGELGSLLSSGYDAAVGGDDTPPGESGNEPTQPTEGDTEFPGGEGPDQLNAQPDAQPTDQNAQPNAQPDANAEPIPGWKQNADGTYTVPSTELPRVQSALQYSDAVSQFFTTPQEAQASYATSSQMRQLQNDWAYGTDDAIKSVLGFLAGGSHPDPSGRMAFNRSFGRMLQMAPDVLQQSNPQAYSALVSSFGQRIFSNLYTRASEIAAQYGPDSQPAKEALENAQAVEWGLTGKYQTELPKVDPQAQARAQFEQQQRDFNARQDAALKRDVQAFNNSTLEGAKLSQLDSLIASKLAPIKSRFPETAFQDLVAGIHREVIDSLSKQSDWYTEHRQAFDQLISDFRTTWTQGSPGNGLQPRVQAYINDFLSRAKRVIDPIAQKRINAATQGRVNAANSRNRTNGSNAQGANAGANRPTPASNGTQNGRPNMSRSDAFDKLLNDTFAPFRG